MSAFRGDGISYAEVRFIALVSWPLAMEECFTLQRKKENPKVNANRTSGDVGTNLATAHVFAHVLFT